jgi:cytochrome b translational activator protein CBS2
MRTCLQCARACREAGPRAARHYGTVTSGNWGSGSHDRNSRGDIQPLPSIWSNTKSSPDVFPSRLEEKARRTTTATFFPPSGAESAPSHKIHILGDDARSRFIAHALYGVYESVELLGYSKSSVNYDNIQYPTQPRNLGKVPYVIKNRARSRLLRSTKDDSHIDQLVVTGNGVNALKSLSDVKHRVDEDTTVCLLNDGLGVLEDVKKKIFKPGPGRPKFVLGHMSHRLAFNRDTMSARLMKDGALWLTERDHVGTNFVETVRRTKELYTQVGTYDVWLQEKLPAVIFSSVVDPTCVAFDQTYAGLRSDPAARRMMKSLLGEIVRALQGFPELGQSAYVRDFFSPENMDRQFARFFNAKQKAPCEMLLHLRRGLPLNIDYLTGFFVKRAQVLNIGLRMNRMVWDMVKAKHAANMEKLNNDVPMEETSVSPHLSYRFRNGPMDWPPSKLQEKVRFAEGFPAAQTKRG